MHETRIARVWLVEPIVQAIDVFRLDGESNNSMVRAPATRTCARRTRAGTARDDTAEARHRSHAKASTQALPA
jgi:hypothetical protein